MRWDDSDDPFSDIFREIERMMDEVAGADADRVDDGGSGDDAHFSVYEEGDQVRVVGDLPGATREDISVRCDGRYLTVDAASDDPGGQERIRLPARVDEHSATASFNNGVLEIVLERAGRSADLDID